jgi:PIN domain nuclease of toxin-antitoxin system
LRRQREAHNIETVPIDEAGLRYLATLPSLHRDPFDRILVAQALQHGLTLVTVDDAVLAYPVPVLSPSSGPRQNQE